MFGSGFGFGIKLYPYKPRPATRTLYYSYSLAYSYPYNPSFIPSYLYHIAHTYITHTLRGGEETHGF
jgi:hypothetical protein